LAVNAVALTGEVAAIDALRHTPAGVPIVGFTVRHQSAQPEAGQARRTGFEILVMAVGEAARAAARLQVGEHIGIEGFLAARARKGVQVGRELVLHVTKFTES
jgi:primosomal replication protein N